MNTLFETRRLVARRFLPRDIEAFVAMRNDPEVARYQSWESYSEAEGRAFLEDLARLHPGCPGWYQVALEDKATGRFVGDCGIRIMEHEPRLAQIGYTIARDGWNRGLATEAVGGLVDYMFAAFPLHRITASADPRNAASCRVLEKAGFVKEAHFRQSEWFKGEWADDVVYARLRSNP
ncbi:GNAT family N-acetyltransferase [Aestuariivirga sp.]|uniref:GNAT family N-acetyltransferase n=1 Tax=Aestuariivirga sp. TaxID=2650926 RepID=UPI003594180B